ncbi:SDR family oxidoreductase [Nocardioidaceae bacterium]|nr:SDR family oxidoreductase [Nocardioidaceae bacterium]
MSPAQDTTSQGRRRTHLVTGGGSGIGSALVRSLLARGDEVLLVARSGDRAGELEREFAGARAVVADLGQPSTVAGLEDDLPDRLDSVVHSAGVVELTSVADLDHVELSRTLAVNLVSAAELTRIALGPLRRAQGTVVFVNSGSGLRAKATWGAYAASKFGLRGLAEALRDEETDSGVRVTSVYPGRTATPMQQKVHEQEGKHYDPAEWSDAQTVADAILTVLDLPSDSTVTDLQVRPRG